ncbi:MFS family permease [Neobacillus niacini]|uniref:MFS transporter n=1 Tax=Neobacillus niacini TaxID=86668 RepID=UPI00278AB879|nr:MFS transporter [Neobacillus niacini]MDQ1002168.1 MFS family permease [Neobacillus niacini]
MNNSKLWTKDFIIFTFASFFLNFIFFLLLATITVYSMDVFNASESKAGLIAGIFSVGMVVSRIFIGKYMDWFGRKRLLYSGLILFLIASLMYLFVKSLTFLIIVRLIHGVGFGISTLIMTTVVLDTLPKERRGEGAAYFNSSATIATAIGPFLGIFLLQYTEHKSLFILLSIVAIVSVLISLFARIPKTEITKEQLEEMKGIRLKQFFEGKALPISIVAGLIAVAYSGVISFLTPYAIEIKLTTAASIFFIILAMSSFISRFFTGRLFDTKGENVVMYPAILLFSSGILILSQSHHGFVLLMAGSLIGIGFGTIFFCSQVIALKKSPPHRVGLAIATFLTFIQGAYGIGPFLLGYLISVVNYRGMYITLAILSLFCIFLYYSLHGKESTKRIQTSNEYSKNV